MCPGPGLRGWLQLPSEQVCTWFCNWGSAWFCKSAFSRSPFSPPCSVLSCLVLSPCSSNLSALLFRPGTRSFPLRGFCLSLLSCSRLSHTVMWFSCLGSVSASFPHNMTTSCLFEAVMGLLCPPSTSAIVLLPLLLRASVDPIPRQTAHP